MQSKSFGPFYVAWDREEHVRLHSHYCIRLSLPFGELSLRYNCYCDG